MVVAAMKTSDFDYTLPVELIAQTPIEPRDQSRLMVLARTEGSVTHARFRQVIDCLRPGDVLVFNDSRVIPARLNGRRVAGGGRVEILLLRRIEPGIWQALVRPGKRIAVGTKIELIGDADSGVAVGVYAEIERLEMDGVMVIRFSDEDLLSGLGAMPLPPYIRLPLARPERYQTVYARDSGSVAAPTAGLHFTPELLAALQRQGIHCLYVTLHIGLDTFRPVRVENPHRHPVYREYGALSQSVAAELSRARAEGRRIIAVGTTTVRLLEQVGQLHNPPDIQPFQDWVDLFILPGHRFRLVDGLITNFHLPRSTLLMLVTAFAGRELITAAYQQAIDRGYRFYSFGDAMLIV